MVKIYARNTIVKKIENEVADEFNQKHHRQSSAGEQLKNRRSIALYFKDEMVAVAQFCFPRTSAKKRDYSTELLRLCFKENVEVVGGASKLVKYYINNYHPADIFTYQDTTGENTNVYEHCGFIFVKEDKEKKYLIHPGKTLKNADRKKKEILSIYSAAKLGPDALLGTKIGEQFHKNGERKTNIELFQELGWTIEKTSGDKVYEWINPNVSFYTYKITAKGSDKYYYGIRSIRTPYNELTIEECLSDGYFGSGGKNKNNKFKNWKEKHKDNLSKEIIGLFNRKSYAYQSEKELIGDLWKTDELCLNSVPGGYFSTSMIGPKTTLQDCPKHGLTKFRKSGCWKCTNEKNYSIQVCNIHGETIYRSDWCVKCKTILNPTEENCEKHGKVKFQKGHCCKCLAENFTSIKECTIHGKTLFMGEVCCKCTAESPVNNSNCEIHGQTVFVGETCAKCRAKGNVSVKFCEKHGNVKFVGDKCYQCIDFNITYKICPKHGETKFAGNTCAKCTRNNSFNKKECSKHGMTKFSAESCLKCKNEKAITIKFCEKHGNVKHNGDKCYHCIKDKNNIKMECQYHGLVVHSSKGNCKTCISQSNAHKKYHTEDNKKENCVFCNN